MDGVSIMHTDADRSDAQTRPLYLSHPKIVLMSISRRKAEKRTTRQKVSPPHAPTHAFRTCFLWKQKWPCLFARRVWVSISPVEMHCNCDSVLKCSHVAIPPTDYQHVMPGPNPLCTNIPGKKNTTQSKTYKTKKPSKPAQNAGSIRVWWTTHSARHNDAPKSKKPYIQRIYSAFFIYFFIYLGKSSSVY